MIIYPKIISSYSIDSKEESKIIRQILKLIKKKKLPKGLEVSIIKDILKILEESSEHEYKEKYDTAYYSHPYFY